MLNTNALKSKTRKSFLQKEYVSAMQDSDFASLVRKLNLSVEETLLMTSKLQNTICELRNCKECKGLFMCKNALEGHVSLPIQKEERTYFTYTPCKYKAEEKRKLEAKKTGQKELDKAKMKDIDVTDKKRAKVIKWLDAFYEKYDMGKNMKGLYLHGNFGSGKTFLISALFHELEEKKHVKTCIVYFPELLRNLKEDWDAFEDKIKYYQKIDLLLIDDIGAEKVTDWGRDEVLGTILQYRMEESLPTFFTSNLNLEELENHLKMTSTSVDSVKSRRIIERIKQVSVSMEMISENRRK